jgi:hypothetical protein
MAISKLSWTGTAREQTPGVAVTIPTLYIPTKTTFKGGKKVEYLNEERGTRDGNYGVVDSVRQSAITMKGPWYNDTSPVQLWAAFGLPNSAQPNATAAPQVYKHTIQLQNIPPSYTIVRSLDVKTYYIPYSVLEKWTLSFTADGKLLEMDSSWVGLFAQYLSSPPTPSYSTVLPFAGYAPTLKFVDGQLSNDVAEMQIEYQQKVTLWYPSNGSQDFVTVYFGERTMKVDFTARFDNSMIYDRFRNGVMDSLTMDVQGPNIAKFYTVSLGSPTGGTFTLTYNGQTTSGIAYNATAAAVQSALSSLSTVGAGNVTVSGNAGGPYTVSFANALLNDGNVLSGSGAGLTGGTFSVGAETDLKQELNLVIPNMWYDSVEHDTSKDNILIKAKATAVVPSGSVLVSGFVQNTVTGYTS